MHMPHNSSKRVRRVLGYSLTKALTDSLSHNLTVGASKSADSQLLTKYATHILINLVTAAPEGATEVTL